MSAYLCIHSRRHRANFTFQFLYEMEECDQFRYPKFEADLKMTKFSETLQNYQILFIFFVQLVLF